MVSVAQKMNLPKHLILQKKSYGKNDIDYFNSSKKIIEYINSPENNEVKKEYIKIFSELLKNNYYIIMTRGRKGCFVYFSNNEKEQ